MGLEHFQVWKCFKRRKFFKSQNYKIDNCNFITIRRHVTIFYRTRWKKIETSSRSFIKKKKKLAFPPEKTSIHLRGRSKMKNPPTVSPNKDESPLCRRSCRDIMKHLRFTKVFDMIVSISYEIRNKDALYFITSFS